MAAGGALHAAKLIKVNGGIWNARMSSSWQDSKCGTRECRIGTGPLRNGAKIAEVSSFRWRETRVGDTKGSSRAKDPTFFVGRRRSGVVDLFAGCRRQCRCRDLAPLRVRATVARGGGGRGGGSRRGRGGVAMAMLERLIMEKTIKVGRAAGQGEGVRSSTGEAARVSSGPEFLLEAGFLSVCAPQSRPRCGFRCHVSADRQDAVEVEIGSYEGEWTDHDVLESGWAPWEESLEPEGEYALRSLNGEEMDPDEVEAILKKRQASFQVQREENAWENRALWQERLVFTRKPPHDWPPEGWYVDPEKLAFMHGGKLPSDIVIDDTNRDDEALKEKWSKHFITEDDVVEQGEWSRWNAFLEDYQKWEDANREELERQALQIDPKYYHGRRRTGELYWPGMFELPFIDPGQHWWGVVTAIHLYEGAFVNFGCVHDAWIPIRDNDWYEIRKHVYVGMHCHVEVVAKRSPYRFRFPIECRFVEPNIDHLIFRKFEYPPIMSREDNATLEEIARESSRPFWPKPRMRNVPQEVEYRQHPDVVRTFKVWKMAHMAVEMEEEEAEEERQRQAGVLRTEDEDEDDKDQSSGEEDEPWKSVSDEDDEEDDEDGGVDWDLDDPNYVELFPMDEREEQELDLESARRERAEFEAAMAEADARGIEFEPPRPYYEARIQELERMQWQRHMEHYRAAIRDNMRRLEEGLPLEEPTRWVDRSWFGENNFDPEDKRFSHSYFGDPEQIEREEMEGGPRKESLQERSGASGEGEETSLSAEVRDGDDVLEAEVTDQEQEDDNDADGEEEEEAGDDEDLWTGSLGGGNGQDRDAVNGMSRGKLSFRDMFRGDSISSEGVLRGVLPQAEDEDERENRKTSDDLSGPISSFENDARKMPGQAFSDDKEEEEEE